MDVELLLAIALILGIGIVLASGRRAKSRATEAEARPAAMFVVVKLPESIAETERVEKYDRPLEVALARQNLGRVIGGVQLAIALADPGRGLPFLKRELLRLGVPKQTTLEFTHYGVNVAESVMSIELEPGQRYRVIKAFTDHDRDLHPEGEEWTFLRSAFVPYHSGMSWFVSFDGVTETHIRMQSMPEEQGPILNNLAEYLLAI